MHLQKTVLQEDQEIGKKTGIRTEKGEIGTGVTGRGHAAENVGDHDPERGSAGHDLSLEIAAKGGKLIA